MAKDELMARRVASLTEQWVNAAAMDAAMIYTLKTWIQMNTGLRWDWDALAFIDDKTGEQY